jgi:hypothetical protein
MTATEIIEGLKIIQRNKHASENDYHIRFEHDEMWAGSLKWPISIIDEMKLKSLGWIRDTEADGWRASV